MLLVQETTTVSVFELVRFKIRTGLSLKVTHSMNYILLQ